MFIEISYMTKIGYVRAIRVNRFARILNLNDCDVIHIELHQLARLKWLKRIDLSNNSIEEIDFTALECMTHLKEISFENNRITSLDFSAITTAVNWKSFDISENHVAEVVTPIEPQLRIDQLDLSNNQLDQFDLIGFLPHTKKLRISGNEIPNVSYDMMPKEPTQKQKQKVESFVKKHTQNNLVQKLDMQISFLLTFLGGATIVLVLFVRASQPDFLNSVYIYLGILNIIVSICFPFLYGWVKYRDRPDWKIAIYKILWIYFASTLVVIAGILVSPYSNIPFIFLQSTYDTIEVHIVRTLISPIISITVLYILAKLALSWCNLIDYHWTQNLFKSSFNNKTHLKTYIDICLVCGSVDYLMWVFAVLNYMAFWPLISGVVITNLSRYYASPILSIVFIFTMMYFTMKTISLSRNGIRKQIGTLEICSCIKALDVSKNDPFSHFPF